MTKLFKVLKIFTPILFLVGGIVYFFFLPSPQTPIQEGENFFKSPIYSHYHQQLKQTLQQHPEYAKIKQSATTSEENHLKNIIEIIDKENYSSADQRIQYEKFIKEIRSLATMKSSSPLFSELINWLFLKANLHPDIENFLYSHVDFSPQSNLEELIQMQKALHQNPEFQGTGTHPLFEDQLLHANIPSKIITLPTKQSTQLIRIGQPILQSSFFPRLLLPKVSPEFVFFIQQQPSHLYINLMKREGVEKKFSQLIENLEKDIPQLYVVSLDKNSSFYWQTSISFPEQQPIKEFKDLFLKEMLKPNGAYFWSRHLPTEWKATLSSILDHVHQIYFFSHKTLDRIERQDFIEITYLNILDQLVIQAAPSSMNITCRQGMDRGPSLATLWIYQKDLLADVEIASLLLAPPLVLHNRASHVSRILRFVSAAKRLDQEKATHK